ncbi:MAG: hypothetical protein II723_02960 [Oscillospiraceae bacterium]|nr:hypothetical protein [Oscillospiraceae bacterium]
MFLNTEKCRQLAGLLCASLLLGSCGMIVDDMQSDIAVPHTSGTSRQTTSQAETTLTSATKTSAENSASMNETTVPDITSASSQQTSGATTVISSSQTTTTTAGSSAAASAGTTVTSRTAASGTSATVTSAQSSSSAQKTASTTVSTVVKGGKLSPSDQAFLADCVFVGDSICSGLSVYKILPAKNVVAKGSVGVRSIFDYKFTVNGTSCGVISALSKLKPKTVIFSMGMNDINMTSSQKYCENYKNLLQKTQEALPNAKLCVASITPITTTSKFATNAKIDSYNAAIRDYLKANYPAWTYVNVASGLKNEWNGLVTKYTSGDGIHLSPAAYQIILSQVCQQLAPKSTQTTAN